MKIKSKSDIVFDTVNYFIMILALFVTLYPLWYIFIASLSNTNMVLSGKVVWKIKGFTLDAYKQVSTTPYIWSSYANTVFYSVFGTVISMFFTITCGYALSKKRLEYRKTITMFILVSMWFHAGMMPTYLNFRNLGLLDTRTGILLNGAISTFNLVLMRTFFESVPDSMEESAKLDGATDIQVLTSIYIPLSVPAVMTLTLYYFVARWNAYFWSMILLKTESKVPLQVILKKLVVEMSAIETEKGNMDFSAVSRETMTYALMVIAVLPMIIIYPFVQKFFVKGIMVGAIKG